MIRRTASEVLRNLEMRVARLERKASSRTQYEFCFSGESELDRQAKNITQPFVSIESNLKCEVDFKRDTVNFSGEAKIDGLTILVTEPDFRTDISVRYTTAVVPLSSIKMHTRDLSIHLAKKKIEHSGVMIFNVVSFKFENVVLHSLNPKVVTIKGSFSIFLPTGGQSAYFDFVAHAHFTQDTKSVFKHIERAVELANRPPQEVPRKEENKFRWTRTESGKTIDLVRHRLR